LRYGIFSDVHANLEALEAFLKAIERERIGQFLCIGDIVGYGANPNECVHRVKGLNCFSVAGNHDWASVDLFPEQYFNSDALEAIKWTRNQLDTFSRNFLEQQPLIYRDKNLLLVHGTLVDSDKFYYLDTEVAARESFQVLTGNICFVGHTHAPGVFVQGALGKIEYFVKDHFVLEAEHKYIVNVGSVGQPRDGNPQASFCIYDTSKREVAIKRVGYDAQTASEKIIKSGLPQFLGNRLLKGV